MISLTVEVTKKSTNADLILAINRAGTHSSMVINPGSPLPVEISAGDVITLSQRGNDFTDDERIEQLQKEMDAIKARREAEATAVPEPTVDAAATADPQPVIDPAPQAE